VIALLKRIRSSDIPAMHLSRFSDLSLRVLMYAALRKESFQIGEVTDAYGISRNHIAKVVHQLSRLGYLETRQGRGGGSKLTPPPAEIRLGELLRETESQNTLVECFDPATDNCKISGCCRLKGILAEAQNAFFESLNRYTLNDLVTGKGCGKLRSTLIPGL